MEALARDGALTEIQSRMVEHQGGQCGFCTPGFVMALTAYYEKPERKPTAKAIQNHLTGNLCRCTGYAPIIEAGLQVDPGRIERIADRFGDAREGLELIAETATPFEVRDGDRRFHGPRTLADAVRLRAATPGLRVFGTATDLGVALNKGRFELGDALSLHGVPDLSGLAVEKDGTVRIGARADLASVEKFLADPARAPEFADFLKIFASPQIKNAATLGGNIINASPIADTVPYLMAAEAELELAGPTGSRRVPITRFYSGYKKFDLRADELLVAIRLPARPGERFTRIYKVSQRRDLDISAVSACFEGVPDGQGGLRQIRVAYGGVGPTALRLPRTEAALQGRKLDRAAVEQAAAVLGAEITPISDVRGTAGFRTKVATNLLRKYCFELGRTP